MNSIVHSITEATCPDLQRLTTSECAHGKASPMMARKHEEYLGYEPFPFEGSSDVRNRLIDNVINQLVMLVMTSCAESKHQSKRNRGQ